MRYPLLRKTLLFGDQSLIVLLNHHMAYFYYLLYLHFLNYFCVMTYKQISSTQNQLIKQIVLLKEKSRERRKSGLFVVEGLREIQLTLQGDYDIETLLFFPEICPEDSLPKLNDSTQIIEISKDVYQKIAHRDTTEGIIAIAKSKLHQLENLKLSLMVQVTPQTTWAARVCRKNQVLQ